MPFKNIISLFIFLFNANICFSQSDSVFKNLRWLEGSWKGDYNGQPFYEGWRLVNNELVNFEIKIHGGDTIVSRQNQIKMIDGVLHLGKGPVYWKLKRLTSNEMMFENDTAKYSNRIIWLHLKNDHWFTILQNPKTTAYYDMVRVPELEAHIDKYLMNAGKSVK
jgi:hypothetical protein